MTELKESLFGSIDEIVKARIAAIKFDNTVVCTIIDASNSANGEYIVSNDSTSFYAYSENTTYKEKDSVQVMIPQGDYDNQKIIIGKYTDSNNTPYVHKMPFDNFLDVTGNINFYDSINSLLANCPENEYSGKQYKKFTLSEKAVSGYTRLGIKADFFTDLKECVSGDYGIEICILTEDSYIPISSDLIPQNRKNQENINENANEDNNIIYYIREENEFIIADSQFDSNVLYYQLKNAFSFKLDTASMYGDPYNFFSYYEQQAVFDISTIGNIKAIEVIFYQDCQFKIKNNNSNAEEQYLQYPYKTLFEYKEDNIFMKNLYISFGYDANEFDSDQAILFTYNDSNYSSGDIQDTNKKLIQLRWIHDYGDGIIKVTNSLVDNAIIKWYRYKFPLPAGDEYCGTSWINIDNNNKFNYSFCPDTSLAQEQIKVIIFINNKIIRSNIIQFNNEIPPVAEEVKKYVNGFWLKATDDLNGQYFLYNNSQIIENREALNEIRTIQCMFYDSELSDIEYIKWTLPEDNCMFAYVDGSLEQGSNENTDLIKITAQSGEPDFNIKYRIKERYYPNNTNNTIKCEIIKDRQHYEAAINLQFGHSGTNGSDYTLVISYDPPEGHHYNAIEYGSTENNEYQFKAQLLDIHHQALDFNNITLFENVNFNWHLYSLVSGTNIEEQFYLIDKDKIPPSRIQNQVVLNPKDANENYIYDTIYYVQSTTDASVFTEAEYYDPTKNYAIKIKVDNSENISHLNLISDGAQVILTPTNDFSMDEIYILSLTLEGFQDYSLKAYLPLSIKNCTAGSISDFEGPRLIRYDSTGYIDYYTEPCKLYHSIENADITFSILNPLSDSFAPTLSDDNILKPIPVYMDYKSLLAIQAKNNNTVLWTQTLFIYQNNYPSGTINQWNGKGLQINEEQGYLIGNSIIAGKKNSDNSFSGVALGNLSVLDDTEDSLTQQTGLYGFNHGAISYAFKEDGTAFIGKRFRGRIEFDGNKGLIKSATWDESSKSGMKIDLDDGIIEIRGEKGSVVEDQNSYIKLSSTSPYFHIKSETGISLMQIGSEGYFLQSNDYSAIDKTGLHFDLKEGKLNAYKFYLRAGSYPNCITINSDSSTRIVNGEEIYNYNPLEIGNNFKVGWDGSAYVKGNILMDTGYISWGDVNVEDNTTLKDEVDTAYYTGYTGLQNLTKLVNGNYGGGTFISKDTIYSPNIIGNQIAVRPERENSAPHFAIYEKPSILKADNAIYYSFNGDIPIPRGQLTSSTQYSIDTDDDAIKIVVSSSGNAIWYWPVLISNNNDYVYYIKASDCYYTPGDNVIAGTFGLAKGSTAILSSDGTWSTQTTYGIGIIAGNYNWNSGYEINSNTDAAYFYASETGVRINSDKYTRIYASSQHNENARTGIISLDLLEPDSDSEDYIGKAAITLARKTGENYSITIKVDDNKIVIDSDKIIITSGVNSNITTIKIKDGKATYTAAGNIEKDLGYAYFA